MARVSSRFASILAVLLITAFQAMAIDPPANVNATADDATGEVIVSWDVVADAEEYTVYLDGTEAGTTEGTWHVVALTGDGDFDFTVTATDDMGDESDPSAAVTVSWDGVLGVPMDLNGFRNEETGEVDFFWGHTVGDTYLQYDNGDATNGYNWPGNTMAMRLTTDGPARILKIEFNCFYNETDPDGN
ncbi:hypothetical protein GF324_06410, partial [bacterium]|nr:hypothetical protein [bacterium]